MTKNDDKLHKRTNMGSIKERAEQRKKDIEREQAAKETASQGPATGAAGAPPQQDTAPKQNTANTNTQPGSTTGAAGNTSQQSPMTSPPVTPSSSNSPKRNFLGNILDNIRHPVQLYKRHPMKHPVRNGIIAGAAVLLIGGYMIHGCHSNANNNGNNGSSIRQEQNIEKTVNVYQTDAKKRRDSTQVSYIYANSWSEKLEALFRYYTQDELDSLRAHSKNIQEEIDKLGLATGATQLTFGKNPQTKKDNTITNIQFGISMYKIMGYHKDAEMRKYRKGLITDRKTDDERVNFYERYFDYAEKSAERNDKTALTYVQQTLPGIADEFNHSEYDKTQPVLYSRFTKLKQTIIDATDSTKTAAATKRK